MGFVLIFIKSYGINQVAEKDFEATGIKLQMKNATLFIIGINSQLSGNVENYFLKFESLLTDLTQKQLNQVYYNGWL